jgi:hypothetical protein
MSDCFISQIAISRIDVYNMMFDETKPEAVCVLRKYYEDAGNLIEKYIIAHRAAYGALRIEGASHISGTNAIYFRNLLLSIQTPTPVIYCHALEFVRAEIMGVVSSTRQNLENLLH